MWASATVALAVIVASNTLLRHETSPRRAAEISNLVILVLVELQQYYAVLSGEAIYA